MFKVLKNIFVLAFLLVLLFSISGFSMDTRYCSCSKKTTRSIFSEFTVNQTGCGNMVCSISEKNTHPTSTGNIAQSACCKELSELYKIAAVRQHITFRSSVVYLLQNHVFQDIHIQVLLLDQNQLQAFLREHYIPQPLAGKQLVLFLQQIRISAPSSVS